MDETNRAASVKQLQELHASLPALIDAAVSKAVRDAVMGASAVHEQRVAAVGEDVKAVRAAMPPPQDLTPLIAAIADNTAAMRECAQMMAKEDRPKTKTGTVKIGGEVVTLRIVEAA